MKIKFKSLCICYILHDDASYLTASMQSCHSAGKMFACAGVQHVWLLAPHSSAFGNLTTLVDANGKISTFGYAGTGSAHQRIRQTDPLGRVTAKLHDRRPAANPHRPARADYHLQLAYFASVFFWVQMRRLR